MHQPHKVQVQKRTKVRTPHGEDFIQSGEPVDLKCSFRHIDSGEVRSEGTVLLYDTRLLTTSEWPGGRLDSSSQVIRDGLVYDMVGIPLLRDGSPRTRHYQVNLTFVGVHHG